MIVYADNRAPTGRLLFFSLSKTTKGEVGMTLKKTKELKAPVFAAIPYGQVGFFRSFVRTGLRGDAKLTVVVEFPHL